MEICASCTVIFPFAARKKQRSVLESEITELQQTGGKISGNPVRFHERGDILYGNLDFPHPDRRLDIFQNLDGKRIIVKQILILLIIHDFRDFLPAGERHMPGRLKVAGFQIDNRLVRGNRHIAVFNDDVPAGDQVVAHILIQIGACIQLFRAGDRCGSLKLFEPVTGTIPGTNGVRQGFRPYPGGGQKQQRNRGQFCHAPDQRHFHSTGSINIKQFIFEKQLVDTIS